MYAPINYSEMLFWFMLRFIYVYIHLCSHLCALRVNFSYPRDVENVHIDQFKLCSSFLNIRK